MKSIIRDFLLVYFVSVLISTVSAAHAQYSAFTIENMPNIFGVGVGLSPDYQGSDDYTVGAAPFGRYTFSGKARFIQLLATEIYVNVTDHPFLRLGPVVNYRFGRDDVEDDIVKKMKNIKGTLEAGLIGGVTFIDNKNPRKRFISSVEFQHDVGDVHDGYIVSLRIRYWHPVSKAIDVTLGAGATYADDQYMSTYFSVNPDDSVSTGLPIFKAKGGIKDITITPSVVVHLSKAWHIGAGVRYQRLLNDAEDSPVVDNRGSADQLIVGIGAAYSW